MLLSVWTASADSGFTVSAMASMAQSIPAQETRFKGGKFTA